MNVSGFTSLDGTMLALADEKSSSGLPAAGAPWQQNGSFNVKPNEPHRIGYPTSDIIIAAIKKDGVLLLSSKCVEVSVTIRNRVRQPRG